MRISAIRISKLVSGPGYNNTSVAVEVAIAEGEDVDDAAHMARSKVDAELRNGRECETINERLSDLRWMQREAENVLASMNRQIDEAKAIVRSSAKIQALAAAAGIAWNDAGDTLPLLIEPTPAPAPPASSYVNVNVGADKIDDNEMPF